jgi:glutathione S-transferase
VYRLYDYLPSGNGYKIRLALRYLALPYQVIEVDITRGESRTPEFLAKNSNGRIPVLEVPGRGYLAESHAILSFLAKGTSLIPDDPWDEAVMWQWMCFEQYNLEPALGTARFWLQSLKLSPEQLGDRLIDKQTAGRAALAVLERALSGRNFLVGESYSLADIALYAYTHVAPQAGVALDPYPAIQHWIRNIETERRWAPITEP